MRAYLAAIMLASLSALAHAQPGADVSPTIPVHPAVRTIVQLPDEIERVQVRHGGEMMVKGIGSKLYVRPRWDTPAGLEALLEVKTRTLHRIIILQVVERAEDAALAIVVPAVAAADGAERVARDLSPDAPAEETPAGSTSTHAPGPDPGATSAPADTPEPATAPAEQEPTTMPMTGRAGADASRLEFSVHAIAALGTTALHVAGYSPTESRRPHRAVGIRVAGRRPGAWWGVEANVSGEWLVAPTVHRRAGYELEMDGPWLRVDGGLRIRFEGWLTPTASASIGLQAHHRDIKSIANPRDEGDQQMPFGGVLALGVGLEYRTGNVLVGLELHMRQGVPDYYRSVEGLLSVGLFLDQGE